MMHNLFKEKPPQTKSMWHRLLSFIMAIALMVTTMIVLPQSKETVQAADLSMKVNSEGNIEWTTTSTVGTSSIRFRTIGWYFSFYYKNSNGTYVQSPSEPIRATMANGKIYASNNIVGTYSGSDSSATMRYELYGLREYYSGDDKAYKIIANAYVEFYDYANHRSLAKVSSREDAEATARRYGMSRGPYFTNYYNREVDMPNVRLTASCDSGLINPTINGSKGNSFSESKAETWVQKGSENYLSVEAKTDSNGNKGYVCVSATRAGEKISSFETTDSQGGNIPRYSVSKNATIEFHSKPLVVTVNFYVDGDKIGSQKFTYGQTDTFGNTDTLNGFSGYDIKKWYVNEDGKTGKSYKLNLEVGKAHMMELYNLNGTFDVDNDFSGETIIPHKVNLYAVTEDVPTHTINDPDFKIVYDGNGSTSGTMRDQVARYDTDVMLTHIKYEKDGYHYNKSNTWKSKKSGVYYDDCQTVKGSNFDFDGSSKKTVTLYAQWKPNKCSINYDGNGSTSGAVSKQTITFDQWTKTISENTYKKDGESPSIYWNTEPDGSGIDIKAGTKIDEEMWKKLFGSVNKDGKTITLYAQWDGSNKTDTDDPDITPIGNGNLTYKSGALDMNKSYGPENYEINGSVTLKECMFGEKYEEDTAKVVQKSNGIWVDGDYMKDETDYLIRGGSTVLEVMDKYYTYKGWSVDENAVWSKSQSVINSPNTLVGGKDLAFTYYGYLNPVKDNPEWENDEIDGPISVLMPADSSQRAAVIRNSRDAWMKYESILNSKITKQTNKQDELIEEAKKYEALVEEYTNRRNSITFPSSPNISYPQLPDNPTRADRLAYQIAMDEYNRAWSYYESEWNYCNRKYNEYDEILTKAKKDLEICNGLIKEAEKKLKDACSALNTLNEDITKAIRVPNGTYLYAVWDQYPEFDPMDPIHIYMSDDYSYVTDEWLLEHVRVTDREDGTLTNGTDVVVENFDPVELTKLQHTGGTTVTFRATDSAGNVTRFTVSIIVEDRTPLEKTTPDDLSGKLYFETGYPRFICRESFEIGDPDSPNYYGSGYNGTTTNMYGQKVPVYLYLGGLHPESMWYTDPEWKAEIYQGFENEENNTPEEVWEFSHQDILDIQDFIDTNGLGDMKVEGTLDKFFDQFKKCRTEYYPERINY